MKTMNLSKRMQTLVFFVLVVAISVATNLTTNQISKIQQERKEEQEPQIPTAYARFASASSAMETDFTIASELSIHAVVHVKTKTPINTQQFGGGFNDPFFEYFFGRPQQDQSKEPPTQEGSGSGVIVSNDGYIVTNNHVVDKSAEIEITLNDKRTFKAKLIGSDANTDIALLKIDAVNLPVIKFGNSDLLKVGEWVLAVGNPFNLTSTVTAGIVSAKSRSINILSNPTQRMGIEAFIQTDAAVNPGNSGGALVNTKGELVGINTAIASQTGSYSGYSFAVPINIAKKVVGDLMEYGVVQRALLGVEITDVTKKLADEKGLGKIVGVFVANVSDKGAAKEAGIESDDVILSVNDEMVNSVPELQEKISRYRPGDKIKVLVNRKGKEKLFTVTLRNSDGLTSLMKAEEVNLLLGAKLLELSDTERQKFQINTGVKVVSLQNGKLRSSGVRDGYIITKANRMPISTVDDFRRAISSVDDGLLIGGFYPNGKIEYYAINLAE